MTVQGLETVSVVDDDVTAILAVKTFLDDPAAGRGDYPRTLRG